MSPHKENLCYIGCKISFVTIYALCCEMCFVAIYALLCGEKFIQKFSMWRKNDKYEVWTEVFEITNLLGVSFMDWLCKKVFDSFAENWQRFDRFTHNAAIGVQGRGWGGDQEEEEDDGAAPHVWGDFWEVDERRMRRRRRRRRRGRGPLGRRDQLRLTCVCLACFCCFALLGSGQWCALTSG